MAKSLEIPLRVTHDHNLAQEWELVLLAEGLSPSVRWADDGVILSVPAEQIERARAGLAAYDIENSPKLQEGDEPVRPASWAAGIAAAGVVVVFFSLTVIWNPTTPWFERGSADASRILLGEFWRTVTALTLHADIGHALSNAAAGAFFIGALSSILGPGLACALILLTGAGGNLVNALVQASPHVSVGASTAIFGAVGMLGGVGMVKRRRRAMVKRRAWMPIAAALGLLAMLGTAGGRVDVWAHFFGFLLGAVLGIFIGFAAPYRPRPGVQWACGSAAVAALIYCWTLALS